MSTKDRRDNIKAQGQRDLSTTTENDVLITCCNILATIISESSYLTETERKGRRAEVVLLGAFFILLNEAIYSQYNGQET